MAGATGLELVHWLGSFSHKHVRRKLPEGDANRIRTVAIIDTFKITVKRLLHGKKVLAFA